MERRIAVVIVEDDKEIRELVRNRIAGSPDMHIAGLYANADDFLEDLTRSEMDVVLMDINLPGKNGIECVREAKPLRPEVQFLMLTVLESPAYIFQALCAGATGYLVKTAEPEELVEAVRSIYGGGSPMSGAIARLVVSSFQQQVRERINDRMLTKREKFILDQVATGLLNKEIAAKAGISVETVRKHIRNIYEKLQVSTRVEALRKVYPKG